MKEAVIAVFSGLFSPEQMKQNEPMNNHTSFRIGGNADVFITPYNYEQVRMIVRICDRYNIEYFVIGNGSNILVRDKGFRGVIISLDRNMSSFEIINSTQIKADAGALLSAIANAALDNSLDGFEFASGIPGTIGGAIYMNAGAYGGEIKDVFVCADVLTKDGQIRTITANEIEFGYRTSNVQKEGMIVLNATIQLNKGDYNSIKEKIRDFNKRRADKQPLGKPSAGSTFKRPEGYFAGKLIMDSGLRGFKIGGAQVSEKHCGFIINNGGATAEDIINLISHIKNVVLKNYGITLEPEIRIIGEG